MSTVRPLCVDLDGTLVKSDTLADSLLVLVRTRPRLLLALPAQLLRGKAAFKAYVAEHIPLDIAHLPYNRKLLQFLQQEHAEGRAIYLATGSDLNLARRVASHFGIFSGVLGSDGVTNRTGSRKLDALRTQLGIAEFDYVGNDSLDLPLLAGAAQPMVANPSLRLRSKLRSQGLHPARTFEERAQPLESAAMALRPHQWAKNLLIFLPLILSHRLTPLRVIDTLLAFCCFCCAASSAYIANDLLDIEADRRHPKKRLRPFAAGNLSAGAGLAMAAVCLLLAFSGARFLPAEYSGWLLLYLLATLAYTWYLKRFALVDILVLSGLYTLRLQAGSAAAQAPISDWLAGFSVFLFLSLAIVKRFAELENTRASGSSPKYGRGYLVADLEQLRSFGTASAYAAVIVFAIYISGQDVTVLYRHARLLWLIVPFMILWLSRVWLKASRGQLHEDPVVFALTDRASLLIGAAILLIALLAI